jgi:hypothetical protein
MSQKWMQEQEPREIEKWRDRGGGGGNLVYRGSGRRINEARRTVRVNRVRTQLTDAHA